MSARLPVASGGGSRPVKIFTLGGFTLFINGKPARFGRKAPSRPLALLKYLAANDGGVPDVQVAATLWPDAGSAALRTLAVNVHRLRRLLSGTGTLIYHDRRVALDDAHVWCDAVAFERLLDHAEKAIGDDERMRFCRRALVLYQGDFLGPDEPQPWLQAARQRLRTRFVRASAAQGERLTAAGCWEEARECYQRGLEADEFAEDLCLGLMTCLAALHQPVDGVAAYRRFARSLAAGPGMKPASATRAFYRKLLLQGG